MSIDYDRLRELVDTSESTDVPLINQVRATAGLQDLAPDMARELLRLHDGVEVIRDHCETLAKRAKNAGIRTLAREMDTNAKALTDLLNGDTE